MDKLHVIDVSPMIYAGGSHADEFMGYPVGGIKYLMNRVAVALVRDEDVVLCFDSPSFRSNSDSTYKKGRIRRPPIFSQIETVYDGLSQCGFKCEKYAGYEADDIVEWAVADNYERYYNGTLIYGNDIDLCHSIRNGVQFITTNSAMNDITVNNFDTAMVRGKNIPFNTISAYKVFCGCGSDNIPVLKTQAKYNAYQLFQTWCKVVGRYGSLANRGIGANPNLVNAFASSSGLFTDNEVVDIAERVKLIFPADKPDGVTIEPTTRSDVDMERLGYFLSLYNCGDALHCLGLKRFNLTENQKNVLREKARQLKSGAYAADKNLEAQAKRVESTLIDLESFTKEF